MSDVTPEQIEAAVVKVLAAVLERSEDEIRSDDGRYAAYQWDDGFVEYHFPEIDWDDLTIPTEFETEDWIYGRNDYDVASSIVEDEHFQPESTTDTALQQLFKLQGGALYGAQLAELVRDQRVELDQLGWPMFYGRIVAGESLVEAATGMFLLSDFGELRLEPGEFAEVDEDWVELIDSIEPPALAAHLGMFFQEPQSARCCGAALTGPDEGAFLAVDRTPAQQIIVSWWIGEGQGDCYLARILDDTIADVPEFQGRELLTREAEPELPRRSGQVASSDEVTSVPLREHLEGVEHEDYRAFLDAVGDRDIEAFIAGISIGQPNLWKLLTPLNALHREGNAHAALALLHTVRSVMTEEQRVRTELRWAKHLYVLGCFQEAVEAFARCEEIGELCSEYFMRDFGHVYADYARAALDAGEFDLAVEKADAALAEEEDLGLAVATKGVALYARGDEDEAFELIETVMHHGIDPHPHRELAEDDRYRELALQNSIPVPVWN